MQVIISRVQLVTIYLIIGRDTLGATTVAD